MAPSVILDTAEAFAFDGGNAFIGRKDVEQTHRADGLDPGSDDLNFEWSFGQTTMYFNNGLSPDPFPSPDGTFPFTATDIGTVTFTLPGLYTVGVRVTDDDGGSDAGSADSLTKVVTDDCDCTKSKGFWKHQSTERTDKDQKKVDNGQLFAEDILAEYLNIVNFGSSVFTNDVLEDGVPLTTLAETHLILSGKAGGPAAPQVPQSVTQDISTENKKKKKKDKESGTGAKDQSAENNKKKKDKDNSGGSNESKNSSGESKESNAGSKSATGTTKIKGQALSQLLAAWLNYAKGAIELDEEVVVDGGDTGSGASSTSTPSVTMTFQEIIAEVETILNNPDATKSDLERAKNLAESVNLHDKNNPDCETGSDSGQGSETESK